MSGEPLLTWLNALLMRRARINLGVSFSIDSNPDPLLLSAFLWERLRLGLGFTVRLGSSRILVHDFSLLILILLTGSTASTLRV